MIAAAPAHLGSSGADEGREGRDQGGQGKGGEGSKEGRGREGRGARRGDRGEEERIGRKDMHKFKCRGSLWQTLKAYRSSGTVDC